MKKLAYIIIGILLISCCTSSNEDEKIVTKVLNEFITAVQDKNYSRLELLTDDDFVIYENGLVWGLEEFSLKLEEYDSVSIAYTLKDLHLMVDNNTAHTQFHNQGIFTHPDTVIVLNFIESATLVKVDNNWKVKFYHSTHLK